MMPDASEDLDSLLSRFLHGDPEARESFPRKVAPTLRRMAAAALRDPRKDLTGEVVNELYVDLLGCSPDEFEPTRVRAEAFLYYRMKHAARRVRADNTPTRCTTRSKTLKPDRPIPDDDSVAAVETVYGSPRQVEARC